MMLTLLMVATLVLVGVCWWSVLRRRPFKAREIGLGSISEGHAARERIIPALLVVLLDLGRVWVLGVALLIGLGCTAGAFGCAGSVVSRPALSPAGETAFQARRVVQALDVLRDAAIDAEAQTPKLMSTATTRTIVNFHESAVKTIGAVPGGWRPTVSAGLTQLQSDLPPADWSRIAPYVALVRTLIEVSQ